MVYANQLADDPVCGPDHGLDVDGVCINIPTDVADTPLAPHGVDEDQSARGEVLDLLEKETGMHSCLAFNPKLAGWRRRQEEASPWRREYRPRSAQARSSMSC